MPLPDPKSVSRSIANSLLAIDERKDAYQSIAKAKAKLRRIEADITKTLELRKEVTNNLSQLKRMTAIHRILPAEVIGHIFLILCTEEIVSIPHERHEIPPQIIVSHVCSEWRKIALATPALWNNVEIMRPSNNRWVQIATELLLNRAGRRGVTLALDMEGVDSEKIGTTFYDIVLPLNVKKLHLTLSLSALEKLSRYSDDIIASIDEITLDINDVRSSSQTSVATPFLSKIRSLDCQRASFLRNQNLPWAQIRYLNTVEISLPVSTISKILRQSPLLEVCKTHIHLDDDPDTLTNAGESTALPQLHVFHIFLNRNHSRMDTFFQLFECPSLKDLSLENQYWTPETYNIIRQRYNLSRLQKLKLTGYPYPISKVLHDAPMLQELIIARNIIFIDESAIRGISSGKLGRYLASLGFTGDFDVKRVLDMVANRQRRVKQFVEEGRSWQDQISGIKQIFVLNEQERKDFEEEIVELNELGTDVDDPEIFWFIDHSRQTGEG